MKNVLLYSVSFLWFLAGLQGVRLLCWLFVKQNVALSGTRAGQPGRGSGAWAGLPQLNWSHVLGGPWWGRKGEARVPCREMISSPHPLPLGPPRCDTWHPGDKVTPLLWHHGGNWPYYRERRRSEEESEGKSDLQSHLFTQDKVFFFTSRSFRSFSRLKIYLKLVVYEITFRPIA